MTTEAQIEQSLIDKLRDLKYTYRPGRQRFQYSLESMGWGIMNGEVGQRVSAWFQYSLESRGWGICRGLYSDLGG